MCAAAPSRHGGETTRLLSTGIAPTKDRQKWKLREKES